MLVPHIDLVNGHSVPEAWWCQQDSKLKNLKNPSRVNESSLLDVFTVGVGSNLPFNFLGGVPSAPH